MDFHSVPIRCHQQFWAMQAPRCRQLSKLSMQVPVATRRLSGWLSTHAAVLQHGLVRQCLYY
eukprot:2593145-Amphidinium_carterae.1